MLGMLGEENIGLLMSQSSHMSRQMKFQQNSNRVTPAPHQKPWEHSH